jgi:hypothetical protein
MTGRITIRNSNFSGNSLDGISVRGASVSITDSTVNGNGRDGMNLGSEGDHSVDGTQALNNGRAGVTIEPEEIAAMESAIDQKPVDEQPALRKRLADVASGIVSGLAVEAFKKTLGLG